MRREKLSITVGSKCLDYVENVTNKLGANKSEVIELLIDIIQGNFTDDLIKHHYSNVYLANKCDGRKGQKE